MLYNFSTLIPDIHKLTEIQPDYLNIIIKFLNEQKGPLESCIFLLDIIRRLYPTITTFQHSEAIKRLIMTLRSFMTDNKSLPMLKTFNYGLHKLKQ